MELINDFTNLSKTLSEKFSLKKSEVSLYLLALIQDNSQKFDPHLVTFATNYNHLIEFGVLDWDTFCLIKNSGLVDLGIFDENQLRAFSEYLIKEYLASTEVLLPTTDFLIFIANLAGESALELHSPDDYTPYLPPIIDPNEKFYLNKESISRALSLSFSRPNPNYRTDRDTKWSIYVANVGTGDIVIKLLENLEEKGIAKNCYVVGQEPNETLNFLTDFNYFAHNIGKNLQTNSEDNPLAPSKNGFGANHGIGLDDEVQIAISIPPFTNVQQENLKELYKFIGSTEKIHFSELAYIELMLKRVSERGKVIAVVRNDFLASKKSKIFREKYLKNDWIEKIIALPKESANYPIDISVIVFNKTKIEKGFVIFDGSEDKFEKTKISIEEVFSNDVDLRVARYAAKESKELALILSKYPQDEVKKVKDLIVSSISGRNYSPNDRIIENSSETLPYIRVTDLSKNDKDFTLDISKVERKISREKARGRTFIDFSAVLVSKIAPKLKPTYFKFTGQPIVIGSDIIALKMKEDVNIEYFLTQLHSRLVQVQVEMMSSGATINRISKEDFLNIQIILPPLMEQRLQVFEMIADIEEKVIAQEAIAKAKEQTDAIEYEVIANMNHSLKNKLGVIINDYDTLVRFLQRKERTNSPVSFNDTIRPVFEGENVADVDTIRLITERLKNNLLDTSKVFNTSLKLQTRELKKTSVELVSYFRNEIKPSYIGENFTIEIVVEPRLKLNVLLDKEVFKDAMDNLVNNAKSHGFIEENREYKIVFELSKLKEVYDEESESVINYARIIYKNDGKPFPKGFSFNDYVRYSSKAGKTQGTGIGGAVINRIIKLHKGKFNELPTDEFSDFSIQFEILLPLDE